MIRVLFFGQLAEIATHELGNSEIDFSLGKEDQLTLSDLRALLTKDTNALALELNKNDHLCAINQTICQTNPIINQGDEVAFMSPLSGG